MPELSNKGFLNKYGEWALVAGAAEGIGATFSTILAQQKINLVMADIRDSLMHEFAEKLRDDYEIEIIELVLDLSAKDAPVRCMDTVKKLDCRICLKESGEEGDRYSWMGKPAFLFYFNSFPAQIYCN